ncbi:Glycosyl phosphatidyl inositol protein transamidase complex subunit [Tulasnella sp. 419]|nr:Glycosyl phosphatidyl inositol protein transamidase complex subunit [Tulasnella sp. 419]
MLRRIRNNLKGKEPDIASGTVPSQTFEDSYAQRLQRRKVAIGLVTKLLPYIITLLYLVGYVWMIMIPLEDLGNSIWIDENALQPGQATTFWDWNDVHAADLYLADIEALHARNASSLERATFVEQQLAALGLDAAIQPYTFHTNALKRSGTNAYGIYRAPRASGAEAIVISASWMSRTNEGEGTPNLRGVATVLALARYLTKYSLWAKDLVFVINDGYMDGMQAWLNAYHGLEQQNLKTDLLEYSSGVIWTAICIDYPGHSFSHLGFFYEGLNGRLPNQDLMNSAVHIATSTGGTPVVLYDHIETSYQRPPPTWYMPSILSHWLGHYKMRSYIYRLFNVKRYVQYQGLNRASGVHGLFHKFRIDAITLFAVPAYGPHGFHTLGKIAESLLRTMNNLLERLHASFFFYVLTSARTFVKFAGYLASAILIAVAMIFWGLRLWVVAGWERATVVVYIESDMSDEKPKSSERWPNAAPMVAWVPRERPVLSVLSLMGATHVVGYITFLMVKSSWFCHTLEANHLFVAITLSILLLLTPFMTLFQPIRDIFIPPPNIYANSSTERQAPLYLILKAFNLYISSIVISITSVLNFSLAASLAVLLGLPLALTSPASLRKIPAMWRYLLVVFVSPMGLLGMALWLGVGGVQGLTKLFERTIWEWEALGVWFLPFACVVYLPLTLQGMLVCTLPEQ